MLRGSRLPLVEVDLLDQQLIVHFKVRDRVLEDLHPRQNLGEPGLNDCGPGNLEDLLSDCELDGFLVEFGLLADRGQKLPGNHVVESHLVDAGAVRNFVGWRDRGVVPVVASAFWGLHPGLQEEFCVARNVLEVNLGGLPGWIRIGRDRRRRLGS